jgi:uncharacterized protein with beta-barrel porin domain
VSLMLPPPPPKGVANYKSNISEVSELWSTLDNRKYRNQRTAFLASVSALVFSLYFAEAPTAHAQEVTYNLPNTPGTNSWVVQGSGVSTGSYLFGQFTFNWSTGQIDFSKSFSLTSTGSTNPSIPFSINGGTITSSSGILGYTAYTFLGGNYTHNQSSATTYSQSNQSYTSAGVTYAPGTQYVEIDAQINGQNYFLDISKLSTSYLYPGDVTPGTTNGIYSSVQAYPSCTWGVSCYYILSSTAAVQNPTTNIATSGSTYYASNLGTSVNPVFQGGTLIIDQASQNYTQNFTLDNSGTNTINQNGQSSTFSGNFTDATSGGTITIANTSSGGSVIFSGQNSYTGKTIIQSGAHLTAGVSNTFSQASQTQINTGGVLDFANTSQNINSVLLAGGTIQSGILNGAISSTGGYISAISGASLTTISGVTTADTNTALASASVGSSSTFTSAGVVNGTLTNAGTFNATAGGIGGAIANNAGGVFNVNGTLGVSSNFTNATSATLNVNNGGIYNGLSSSNISNSGAINVNNGGKLTAPGGITNNAAGTIIVSQGGTVKDDLTNAGSVSNSGTYNANVASNSGSITNTSTGIWNGNVASNSGTISNAGTWSGQIINSSGTFTNQSSGTVSAGLINSGTVNAAGAINGAIANNAGGTIALTGALTNNTSLTNAAGATLTLGSNSLTSPTISNAGLVTGANGATIIGTMANTGTLDISTSPSTKISVKGGLSFAGGSTYQIGITPSTASLTNVTGAVTLSGGTVSALGSGAGYSTFMKYTILTSTAGVTGTFTGATTNVAGYTAFLTYDANDVYLGLVKGGINYVPMAITPNQTAVAKAVVAAQAANTGLNPITTALAIVASNPANVPAALDQLSGAGLAGTQTLAFRAGDLFTSTMIDQGHNWVTGTKSINEIVLSGADRTNAIAGGQRTWRAWSGGYAGTQSLKNDNSTGGYAQGNNVYGGSLGVDYQAHPNLIIGAAGGYANGDFHVNQLGTSGHIDGGQFGFYGTATQGPLYGIASIALSSFSNRTTRNFIGFGTLSSEIDHGSFRSTEVREHFEIGRRYAYNDVTLTPYAALDLAQLRTNNFAETNDTGATNTAALSVAGSKTQSAPAALGLRTEKSMTLGNMKIVPWIDAAFVHEFSSQRQIYATLINLPSAAFNVDGATVGSNSARIKTGVNVSITPNTLLFASFNGDFSGRSNFYAGKAGVRITW